MSLVEHKKDGWTSLPPMAGAAAAAAYTGGQAEFTKALLASETALCVCVAVQCVWLPRICTSW